MFRVFILVFVLLILSQPAQANDKWDVSVGAGGIYKPEYPGADEYEALPLPYVDIEYDERFFLNPYQGLGAYALNDKAYKLGVALGYDFGRDEDDDLRLSGLGDVDATAEAVLFGAARLGKSFEVNGEVRQDILDGHDGMTAEAGIDYKQNWNMNTFLSVGPSVTWASDNYTESYFGVDPAQAAASQFNRFDAEGGISEISLGGNVVHMFTENWFLFALADYSHLQGDAADSPITEEEGQLFTGAFVGYRF